MKQDYSPTEAIILAGGLGTRLHSVIQNIPKPMAPVRGRPFLEHLLDYWRVQGITRFILSVGYLAEIIQSHFGDQYHNCTVDYVVEACPLGTGGGIRQVLNQITLQQTRVVLINGDTWFTVDLPKLVQDADRDDNLPITIALKQLHQNDRYGSVKIDDHHRVKQFSAHATDGALINGGCYLLDVPAVTTSLRSYPDQFSLERDYLEAMAIKGKVGASIQDGIFLDIGVPTDYQRAEQIIGEKHESNANIDSEHF